MPKPPLAAAARTAIETPLGPRTIARLDLLRDRTDLDAMPCSIKVLLEACLRNLDGRVVTDEHLDALCRYDARSVGDDEIAFMPGRVVLQDFTGVPCVVDLAAMRDAMIALGGDPSKVNPLVPCDLVIDHSVQVDAFNSGVALTINSQKEFDRNRERYEFLKWGQSALSNFRVVPPATGIVHQVNIEHLAKVVWERSADGVATLFPDSLVGTDSHTTMVNGLGVVGWGVGGIEAEAVMLGQPIYMRIPEVVGVRLAGRLREGVTATDLVLRVTELLRAFGVVERFVEFFGPGLDQMPVANRATIGNMAPEYGATIGFFPVDERTLEYLRLTGRDERLVRTVEQYSKLQGLWRDDRRKVRFTSELELDLATIEPALAGPRRPQDRVALSAMKPAWRHELASFYRKAATVPEAAETASAAAAATAVADKEGVPVNVDGEEFVLAHGDVVIAAITSCTNTSNPSVMVAAGLLARNAVRRGLSRRPWVKTSLAPGSKVVTEYLVHSGLLPDLEALGFHVVGYGCTTCIGNSGPIDEALSAAIGEHDLVVASVLSGNRNFEGRIHPDVKANYLASPPLVVAYALAGTVDIDLATEPIGTGHDGTPVYLRDLWPSEREIQETIAAHVTTEQFRHEYADVFLGSEEWQAIRTSTGELYGWNPSSTYIQNPPYFVGMPRRPAPIAAVRGARVLAKLGDSVTTDHISPAGSIKADSPAGRWLIEHGQPPAMFNSYGSRRGNDRVMTRGTFANIRIRNHIAPGIEGGVTTDFLDPSVGDGLAGGSIKPIFDAAENYRSHGVPLVVLAGKDYGMGSSRDWAAKGTFLLGVRAVIAESFERIHRSNLVGMGVLPLTYLPGESAATFGLDGTEEYDIDVDDRLHPRQELVVTARRRDGGRTSFRVLARVDTPVEVDYYRNGGILHTVLRRMAEADA
ncbi:MAG TPA: aconitate hydratase AcnA [Phycisphaerales bacterium]|nr:aconitate hydratase AcnA [Phycisphaerales bacterium]HMP37185.1 aconitate hydratase AcnA [Phycisphaerales bacterium]